MTIACRHPMPQREHRKEDGALICNACGDILTPAKVRAVNSLFDADPAGEPEDATIVSADTSKEPCERTADCIHHGDDCIQTGGAGRNFECFETAARVQPNSVASLFDADPANDAEVASETVQLLATAGVTVTPDFLDSLTPEQFTECVVWATAINNQLADCEDTTIEPPMPFCLKGMQSAGPGIVDASDSIPTTTETVTAGGRPTFLRILHVPLAEDELAAHGEEMARLINLWAKGNLDLKAYTKAAKKVIDQYEDEYTNIAQVIAAGEEERQVQCYAEFDFPHCLKRIIRCDTGDLVATETLSKEEMQMDLDFVAGESEANVKEAFGVQKPVEGEAGQLETGEQGEGEDTIPSGADTLAQETIDADTGFAACPADCDEKDCPHLGNGIGPDNCGRMAA